MFWGDFQKSLNDIRGEGQKWIVYKKRGVILDYSTKQTMKEALIDAAGMSKGFDK